MKKFHIFILIGLVHLVLSVIFTGWLCDICSQEKVNLIAETIVGITTVSVMCITVVSFIIAYRIKEGI